MLVQDSPWLSGSSLEQCTGGLGRGSPQWRRRRRKRKFSRLHQVLIISSRQNVGLASGVSMWTPSRHTEWRYDCGTFQMQNRVRAHWYEIFEIQQATLGAVYTARAIGRACAGQRSYHETLAPIRIPSGSRFWFSFGVCDGRPSGGQHCSCRFPAEVG